MPDDDGRMTSPRLTVDDVRAALVAHPEAGRNVLLWPSEGPPGIDNVSVLTRRPDGVWFTAYFERGSYHDPRTFDDEDAACRDFLEMVRVPVPVPRRPWWRFGWGSRS